MSDTNPPAPQAEALAKQLKDSLAHRRPRPWKLIIGALAASTLLLAALAWSLLPRAKQAPLQVLALDVVCTPDEMPLARAQLLAPPDEEAPRRLNGLAVVFHEHRLMLAPGEKLREIVVKSDEHGQASVEWPVQKGPLAEFLVLHIDPDKRSGSVRDRGRIFVWPKDGPLLLVDAEETLIASVPDAKASDALTRAAKDGWNVVYHALAATNATDFRKARGWIENQAKLPKGPVLGRPHFSGEQTAEQARRDSLNTIKSKFKGPMIAVVKNAEAARTCTEVGVRTNVLGDAADWGKLKLTLE